MGFSLIASSAIIGVAVLISLEIIVGTTVPVITDTHESYEDMQDRAVDRFQTDLTITNAVWNNPYTIFTVDNTGSVTVNTSKCTVLFIGENKTFICNVAYLHPAQTALFSVTQRLNNGEMIKLITPNGVEAYYEYE